MGMLLGTYLSRPVTTKYSHDEEDDRMAYGASSMQGWRETQEDAHNCILEYDSGTSFFAVYDGHGGSEVSEYAAQTLPDFLKSNNYYRQGDYENALKDTFIKFDCSLKTPAVVKLLHKLVRMARRFSRKDADRESLKNLKAEALMPLEEVLAQYALARKGNKKSKRRRKSKKIKDSASPSSSKEIIGCSVVNSVDSQCSSSKSNTVSFIESDSEVTSSSSICGVKKKRLSQNHKNDENVNKTLNSTSSRVEPLNNSGSSQNVSENVALNSQSNVSEGDAQPESSRASRSENETDSPSCSKSVENKEVNVMCNGQSVDVQSDEVISSSVENGEVQDVPKSSGKGKSLVKHQPKKTGGGKKNLDDDSSESESDDESFTDVDSNSDDDDDDDEDEEEDEEDVDEEEEEDDEEGEEEEEEEEGGEGGEEENEEEEDKVENKVENAGESTVENNAENKVEDKIENNIGNNVGDNVENKAEGDGNENPVVAEVSNPNEGGERPRLEEQDQEYVEEYDETLDETSEDDDDEEKENNIDKSIMSPGSDSGCTALVVLIKDNKLYVANAGDCRCVVSKNGEAIELSLDHKPENDIELRRIEKAGGRVHGGRVNDGLNLSRALGDHVYKRAPGLPPEEQMISPLPDIQIYDLDPSVEFMILACDGIWNSMSSQEVVDFVRPKLQNRTEVVSKICEQLFDHCLAPDTICDGTGCDNMTAIIVQFKNARLFSAKKRPIEENEAEEAPKKQKTEDVTSTDVIDSSQPSESLLEKSSNSPDTTQ